MAYQIIPGYAALPIPDNRIFMTTSANGFTSGSLSLAAVNYEVHFTGRMVWSDQGTHTVSSSGGKIGWRTTTGVTWATSGSTITIGIQDTSTAAGPPARGDGTFDVSGAIVNPTVIASSTFYETAMDSNSKSIAHGATITVVFQFTTMGGGGSDVVTIATVGAGAAGLVPYIANATLYNTSTYNTQNSHIPNLTIISDGGVYGTLAGAFPYATIGTAVTAFNSGSSPLEYANLFSLPFKAKIAGIWCQFNDQNTTATALFSLYTGPLNAGSVTSVKSVQHQTRSGSGSTSAKIYHAIFATPYNYDTPGTQMAMAIQADSGSNIQTSYYEVNTNAAFDCHALGTGCYAVSRNTVSAATAFSTFNNTGRRMIMGLLLSHFDDGTSTGGGAVMGGPFC